MDSLIEKTLVLYGPMWFIILISLLFIIRLCYWCSPYIKSIVESHNNLVDVLASNETKQTIALEETAKANLAIASLLDSHHKEVIKQFEAIKTDIKCK